MKKTYSYDDVLLSPQYSDIRSRSSIDITTNLTAGLKLGLPLIASPMDTVSESDMASAMSSYGGTAVIHRYNSIEEQCNVVLDSLAYNHCNIVGAAIGVSEDMKDRAIALYDSGATFLCVDVAHGHHILMKDALETLRGLLGAD